MHAFLQRGFHLTHLASRLVEPKDIFAYSMPALLEGLPPKCLLILELLFACRRTLRTKTLCCLLVMMDLSRQVFASFLRGRQGYCKPG